MGSALYLQLSVMAHLFSKYTNHPGWVIFYGTHKKTTHLYINQTPQHHCRSFALLPDLPRLLGKIYPFIRVKKSQYCCQQTVPFVACIAAQIRPNTYSPSGIALKQTHTTRGIEQLHLTLASLQNYNVLTVAGAMLRYSMNCNQIHHSLYYARKPSVL